MDTAKQEQKQLKRREYLLNGNMWKVVLSISLPMVFYNLCNYFYGIYDMMLVQSAGIGDAADIVVLDQIKNMISTIATIVENKRYPKTNVNNTFKLFFTFSISNTPFI